MPWLPASALSAGGTLHYTLSARPDPTWGSSPDASPPSFESDQLPAVGFSLPSGATTVTAGQPKTITIGMASAGDQATTVRWQAVPDPGGIAVTPSSGTLTVTPANCISTAPATQSLSITAPSTATGSASLRLNLSTTAGLTLPPIVVDVQVQP
jgi:hypothetical protein